MTAITSRRRLLIAGGAALVAALAASVIVVLTRGPADAPAGKLAAAPVAKPAPSSTAPVPPHHRRVRVPHETVAAAAPTRFSYRAPAWTIRANVCGMAYVRPLDPPGEQHHTVCWVQHGFGFAPGSAGRGTTYVLGHAWAEDPREVLNKISATAMREVLPKIAHHRHRTMSGVATYPVTHLDSDVITLRTSAGSLRYTVRSAYAVAKADAGSVTALMNQHTEHRVVIITCGELHGVDYDYNIIVNAFLTSSQALTSRT
ncbi:MAG TPA: sortase [Jatrophihabitans sp.]